MDKLAETYMELFCGLIIVHKIIKRLRMKIHDMFKVLELAELNHLGSLQGKVETRYVQGTGACRAQSFRTPARKGRKA